MPGRRLLALFPTAVGVRVGVSVATASAVAIATPPWPTARQLPSARLIVIWPSTMLTLLPFAPIATLLELLDAGVGCGVGHGAVPRLARSAETEPLPVLIVTCP